MESNRLPITANDKSQNKIPISPLIQRVTGTNTAMVVSVEAIIEGIISLAPSMAAL